MTSDEFIKFFVGVGGDHKFVAAVRYANYTAISTTAIRCEKVVLCDRARNPPTPTQFNKIIIEIVQFPDIT